MTCIKCYRDVKGTVHTATTYKVDYYSKHIPYSVNSESKDDKGTAIKYVRYKVYVTCVGCFNA